MTWKNISAEIFLQLADKTISTPNKLVFFGLFFLVRNDQLVMNWPFLAPVLEPKMKHKNLVSKSVFLMS